MKLTIEGLQAVAEHATLHPLGLTALQSQTWLCKMMQKVASIYSATEPINATSCILLQRDV